VFTVVILTIAARQSPESVPQGLLFVPLGFVVGLVVGLVVGPICGLICSSLALLAWSLTSRQTSRTGRSLAVAITAGATAIFVSFVIIGPILTTFSPALFAVILAPVAGAAYFASSLATAERAAVV
jgi:hypothetical protein